MTVLHGCSKRVWLFSKAKTLWKHSSIPFSIFSFRMKVNLHDMERLTAFFPSTLFSLNTYSHVGHCSKHWRWKHFTPEQNEAKGRGAHEVDLR